MDTVDDVDAVPAGIGRESNIELKNSEHDSDLTELKIFPCRITQKRNGYDSQAESYHTVPEKENVLFFAEKTKRK